jgi:hypothetical protein
MPHSLSRRGLTRAGVAAAATLVAQDARPSAAVRPRRPYLPYSPDSYFRSDVSGKEVDGEATQLFWEFMTSFPDQQGVPYPKMMGIGSNRWGTPFTRGKPGHPRWRVRQIDDSRNPQNAVLQTSGFRAPRWSPDVLTGTSDSPWCILDTASGFTVFLTRVRVVDEFLVDVGSAAVTYHDSNGLDHRNPRSDDRRNFSSRGRISDAMVVRRRLVDHGIKHGTDLGHVLHMFIVESSSAAGFRHPMVGHESDKYGFGAEGQRLAVRADVDLTRRDLSPAGLVIARTLQRRGCYIGDNSGSLTCFKAEQDGGRRHDWRSVLHEDSLRGLRWDDFVVLRQT